MPTRKTKPGSSKASHHKKAKRPRQKRTPRGAEVIDLPPEEWDFRSIPADKRDVAVVYEYARSADWLVKIFKDWHQQKPPVPTRIRKWSKLTVGEILWASCDAELPAEVKTALEESMPPEFEFLGLEEIFHMCKLFPKPFSQLPESEIRSCRLPPAPTPNRGFLFRRATKLRPVTVPFFLSRLQIERQEGLRWFGVCVNLGIRKSAIKKEVLKWLKDLDDIGIKKVVEKHGRELEIKPERRLKQLAAYRLYRVAGIYYDACVPHVRDYLKENGVPEDDPVMPHYSQTGFFDAVQEARKYLEGLFPEREIEILSSDLE